MCFTLTSSQHEKLLAWIDEQDRLAAERQGVEQPYYGAMGGCLTYTFTPTSLGLIVKVAHNFNKTEIDLSDTTER